MLIVDRIEGDFALCEEEDRSILPIPLKYLPPVREGDVLQKTSEGYRIDPAETERRREKMLARLRKK